MASATRSSIGLYGALGIFGLVVFYLVWVQAAHHILLGVGATFILYSTTKGDLVGSLLAGAILALFAGFFRSRRYEGFQDAEGAEDEATAPEIPAEAAAPKKAAAARKVPLPDHADRPAEMFQLGKKYKMPATEADDKEFHLDAGTTFMHAYKSLKPEQIAAMTKDTQELMETQKQLMGTLQTLKPLIQDGKQMMEMFQSYFGAANPTTS